MKAIVFDLFGTLLRIPRPTNPYLQVFVSANGPRGFKRLALTQDGSLPSIAQQMGSSLPQQRLLELEELAKQEAMSCVLFPDAVLALERVRAAGAAVIVSSNLATPYGAVRRLLAGKVDYWALSYEEGMVKPDARMFLKPARAAGADPKDCVVIGDSPGSDGGGARNAKMRFILIDRTNAHPLEVSVSSLAAAVDLALAPVAPT